MQKKTLLTFLAVLLITVTNQLFAQLKAKFTADATTGCAPIIVKFLDQSTGNPTSWKWDLGNGTVSNLQHPSASYFLPGTYTVKLVIKTADKQDSIIKTAFIKVLQQPAVDFTSNMAGGCSPLIVNFSDKSTSVQGINMWQWDFGDGSVSYNKNPSHTYSTPGFYNVTLKAIDAKGCSGAERKVDYVKNRGVIAGFTTSVITFCSPNEITFNNISNSTDSFTCSWDFGDTTYSPAVNPVHKYKKGGTYKVVLKVRSVYGCESEVIKYIVVQNPVSALFTADKVYSCKYPSPVKFSNADLPGNSFQWDFGDLTTSGSSNPTHIFTEAGMYDVKLVVKNINGCSDSLTRTEYIKVQKPSFGFSNLPDSGCKGLSKKLELLKNPLDSIISYSWNLGDGTHSSLAAPQKTYLNTGAYNISVIISTKNGCVDTISLNKAIQIGDKPVAKFAVDSTIQCANKKVTFKNLSENASSWVWDFGNNSTSLEESPSLNYKDTGWVTVQLISMNAGCADTASYKDYIYLKPAVADFLASMNCATPFLRTFKNTSISATGYLWDFGDGTTSNLFAPSHQYSSTGLFTVTLIARNDSTNCDYTTTHQVKIIKALPSFFASDTMACRGAAVTFDVASDLTDVARYTWDFGDGTSVTTIKTSIAHIYHNPGIYSVRLVTLNILNCRDTIIKSSYIKVNGPVALFGASSYAPCADGTVVFLDSSTAEAANPIVNWTWKYGDGKTETFSNAVASHVYTVGGNFIPTLTLLDSKGCSDSFALSVPVSVTKIIPNFTITDPVVCPGYAARFVCAYSVPGITYAWDFGDSTTSNKQLPTHIYANEGTYTVKLHISVYGCEADYVLENGITVKQTVANFSMSDSFKICPPLLINFTDSSIGAASWSWNFGDSTQASIKSPSHIFTLPGNYTATLTVKGPAGCVKSMSKSIIVKGPTGKLSFTPLKQCRPYNTTFTVQSKDAVSYIWDFNDGSINDTKDSIVTHNYQDSGKFIPKIILVDDAGCRVAINSKDTITNLFVKAAFTFPDSLLCDKATIPLINTTFSNDQIKTYAWNFGDSTTSSQKNPLHSYNAPGEYFPELTVTSIYGCVNYFKSALPVKVGITPAVKMTTPISGCMPLNATFKGLETASNTGPLKWNWDFDNGVTSDLQDPPDQLYSLSGDYNVQLSVFGPDGCYKSITNVITAYPLPLLNKTADSIICKGSVLKLFASGAASYKWSPSNAVVCDTCASTIAFAETASRFYLTGTSSKGCISRDSVKITIKPKPILTYGGDNKLCHGKSTQLTAGGTENFKWIPATGLNDPGSSSPVATPDSTTTYRVIGYDDMGCYKDTGYVQVVIYPLPTVDAGADKSINVGMPAELVANVSNDVSQIRWSPTDGVFRYDQEAITVKPNQNTEFTVEVKNNNGCMAKDKVSVFVLCNGTNVFIPNLFSPNGDGNNDVFYLRGTGVYKVKSLTIYDRWGQPVFQKQSFNSNDPNSGWDGSYRGNKVNADVYIYAVEVICNNSTVLAFNGNIAVVR